MNQKSIHIIAPILTSIWFVVFCIIAATESISPATIDLEGIACGIFPTEIYNNPIYYAANATIIALTAYLLSRLNSVFPLMREHSYIVMMFFLLLEMLSPSCITLFTAGNMAALLIYASIFVLYSCYQQGEAPKEAFLITLLISTASIVYARILYFLPLFILGLYQMKSLSLRTLIAVVIGWVTPFWTAWGMGWISSDQFCPEVLLVKPEWDNIGLDLLPAGISILLGLFTGTNNLMNAHTEKIQTRAMNGFINILSIYATLLILIDTTHYMAYLPILNMGVSLQAAYYFTSRHSKATHILYYTLIVILLMVNIWSFWVI